MCPEAPVTRFEAHGSTDKGNGQRHQDVFELLRTPRVLYSTWVRRDRRRSSDARLLAFCISGIRATTRKGGCVSAVVSRPGYGTRGGRRRRPSKSLVKSMDRHRARIFAAHALRMIRSQIPLVRHTRTALAIPIRRSGSNWGWIVGSSRLVGVSSPYLLLFDHVRLTLEG